MTSPWLSWAGIARLGLVQTCIGAMFALTSLTLNRIMVVEYALPAVLPAAFVAWNYVVQLARPRWGYSSDVGGRRAPWIIGGMALLAVGAVTATKAITLIAAHPVIGGALALVAFTVVGLGVGAAGTSLLALLAVRVAPARRPAAAALTWIMMIVGFIVYAGVSSALLRRFSNERLLWMAFGVAAVCLLVTIMAVIGAESRTTAAVPAPPAEPTAPRPSFGAVLGDIWADAIARRFTVFVFVSMLAYSAQELILEPYAGLVFGMTPSQSAQLTGFEKGGALLGMLLVGALGARFGDRRTTWMRTWTVAGCIGSAVALAGLSAASVVGLAWPLAPTVFALGLANGVFAVAAIGSMMGLAGAQGADRSGARMGVWGGAQAGAFAVGGFLGASGVQALRGLLHEPAPAFVAVFGVEALIFLVSAVLAARLDTGVVRRPGPTLAISPIGLGGAR